LASFISKYQPHLRRNYLPLGFAFPQVVLRLFLLARKHLQASEGLNLRQRPVSHRELLACMV